MSEKTEKIEKTGNAAVQNRVGRIFTSALRIIVIATVLIPAVAAYILRWEWIFVYPAVLVLLTLIGLIVRKK